MALPDPSADESATAQRSFFELAGPLHRLDVRPRKVTVPVSAVSIRVHPESPTLMLREVESFRQALLERAGLDEAPPPAEAEVAIVARWLSVQVGEAVEVKKQESIIRESGH